MNGPAPPTDAIEARSPCIGICQLGPRQFCIGCGRSMEEIAGWLKASEQDKRAICARAAKRLQDSV